MEKPNLSDLDPSAAKVLRVFPLESKEGEVDPSRAGINMPVGSKVVGIVRANDQEVGIAVICDVIATRVWHPVLVMPMDVPVTALLGRRFGEVIGTMPLGGAPAVLVQELPWPQSTLEAVTPLGEG